MKYKFEAVVNGRKFREETCEASSVRQATQILAPQFEFNFNKGYANFMIGSIIHTVRPMEL